MAQELNEKTAQRMTEEASKMPVHIHTRTYISKYNVFFSIGGPFSRRPRNADLGAARLSRRGIDRGPASCESRPCPRPVARAARSQSLKNRVSFAGRPSGSAGPSRRRENRSATVILEKKSSVDPIHLPYE